VTGGWLPWFSQWLKGLIPNGNMKLDHYDGGSLLFSCGQGTMLNETVENRCLSAF
jgi:hypothetical protein